MPNVNAHQSVTSAEEDFHNWVDSMNRPVNTSKSLSLATIVNCLVGSRTKWLWWQEWRLSNRDSHSPSLTWLRPLLKAQSTSSRDQHWFPHVAPFPEVINQLPAGRLITLHHFQHGNKGNVQSIQTKEIKDKWSRDEGQPNEKSWSLVQFLDLSQCSDLETIDWKRGKVPSKVDPIPPW